MNWPRSGNGPRLEVCLATSHGGHLELLLALEAAWAGRTHLWVTPHSPQADRMEREGRPIAPIVNPWRNPLSVLRNAGQALRLLLRTRPRVVVSAGAGVAVPLCLLARLVGARLVFVETTARVDRGSASGRILHRFAHAFLVQWPELQRAYGRAELCRPALMERVGPPAPGRGTFVSAGSHGKPFVRLLELVDGAVAAGVLPAPVTVQARPGEWGSERLEPVDELRPEEIEQAVREAEVVVCHGGSGLISLALRAGRTPLVLPRRGAHGEHFDDHQVRMVEKLDELGLVVSLDRAPLDAATVARGRRPPALPTQLVEAPSLVERVRAAIDDALIRSAAGRADRE